MSTQNLPAQTQLPGQSLEARQIQWKPRFEALALGLIILFCIALRVYHLGAASLWSDEIFSRYYVDVFGLHYALSDGLSRETNPPTYYLLLQGWMAVWGHSEAALRSLSALASILCVPVTYLLGREFGGKSRALAAALLCALCPMSVYFAQEARVYALLMLASSVALWAAAMFQHDSRSWKTVWWYVLSATLCLYLHATGLLFVVACAGAVWLWLLRKGADAKRARWKWLASNGVVLLLGVPYYLHVFAASQTGIINYVPAGRHPSIGLLPFAGCGRYSNALPVACVPLGGRRVPRLDRLALAKPTLQPGRCHPDRHTLSLRCARARAEYSSPDLVAAHACLHGCATLRARRAPGPGNWPGPFCGPA